ncbi:hypothetical protein DSECCO2_444330 [anaerobic digester metagenome]
MDGDVRARVEDEDREGVGVTRPFVGDRPAGEVDRGRAGVRDGDHLIQEAEIGDGDAGGGSGRGYRWGYRHGRRRGCCRRGCCRDRHGRRRGSAGRNGYLLAVGRDDDVPVKVGPVDPRTGGPEALEYFVVGVAVVVSFADEYDADRGADRGEELSGGCVPARVVADLQDVGIKVEPGLCHALLRRLPGVAREDIGYISVCRLQDDRVLVYVPEGFCGRVQDPYIDIGVKSDRLPADRRRIRYPLLLDQGKQVLVRRGGVRLPGVDKPADREGGYDRGKSSDVIGVGMGRHNHVEPFDTEILKVRDDAPSHATFAGVDEHGLIAELEEDRVALTDVDEVDGKVSGGPGDDIGFSPAGDGAAGDEDAGTECGADQVSGYE